ncbi:MAG: hypothetical protein A2017_03175 [Lentisphaerae bacterium GWF2_44_16]|nr:MAG: hypothetical protein A2017_03175 [Lentisphaerae bacterium GWF2_44_16]
MEKLKKYLEKMKKDNRGIALLFSLGMLSLLLVLALSFASNSIIERKVAVNTDNRAAARFLAQSAVNRAIGIIDNVYKTTSAFTAYYDVYSYVGASPTTDFINHIATTRNGETMLGFDTTNKKTIVNGITNANNSLHWFYVKEGLSAAATDKIIGRIAYYAWSNSVKLDPSVTVDSGYYVGYAGSVVNENGANEKRPGREVREINIQNLSPSATNLSVANVSNLSATNAATPGLLTAGSRWPDMDRLFSKLGITTDVQMQEFRKWFTVNNPPDPEAYWKDLDADSIKKATELHHRFNLARTDWDTTMQGATGINILIGASGTTPNLFSAAFDATSGIEWLKNWTDAGGMGSAAACKNQIAANIIDYCDSDCSATTDYADAAPASTTYVGLEQCPYINEINLQFEGLVQRTVGAPNDTYTCTVTIKAIDLELVNMYDTDNDGVSGDNPVSARAVITVSGGYKWNPGPAGAEATVAFTDQAATLDITIGDKEYQKGTAATITISPVLNTYTVATATAVTCGVTDVWIDKLYVKLVNTANNAIFYDFSNIETGSNAELAAADRVVAPAVSTNTTTGSRYIDYSVNDPRQNTFETDWTIASSNAVNGTITPVAVNTVCNPNPGGNKDLETAAQPYNVSTAFIRNGPMQSPWELGAIHRGAAWETINLKKYYSTGTPSTYSNGDANILDMVKMTSDNYTYGKINLNGNQNIQEEKDVLRALFMNIYVDNVGTHYASDYYSDPGAQPASTQINEAKANTLVTALTTAADATKYKNRAQVASIPTFTGGTVATQGNDAQQEAIIGKFINLTKAETVTEFTIIAIAQSIKDLGGVMVKKDLDGDGLADDNSDASHRASEVVAGRDLNGDGDAADTGLYLDTSATALVSGTYELYADEILAEQKIMARVVRDPATGKFKIVRFEYLPSEQ